MIIGMVPMALGLGEGGEQNAPLGRAVIGGLLCATVATLVFRAVGVRPAARRALVEARVMRRPPHLGPLLLLAVWQPPSVSGSTRASGRASAADGTLKNATAEAAIAVVNVVSPKPNAAAQEILLRAPPRPSPTRRSSPRTNGYVKAWYFDIGAPREAGQLLAEIETPEVDQQLSRARPISRRRSQSAAGSDHRRPLAGALGEATRSSKQETDVAVERVQRDEGHREFECRQTSADSSSSRDFRRSSRPRRGHHRA